MQIHVRSFNSGSDGTFPIRSTSCSDGILSPPMLPLQEQQLRDKLDEEHRKATSSRIRQTEQQKEANRSDASAAAASQVGTHHTRLLRISPSAAFFPLHLVTPLSLVPYPLRSSVGVPRLRLCSASSS